MPWKLVTGKLSFTTTQFTNSPTREQSNKRSGTRLKTESETGERRFDARALCAQHLSAQHLSALLKTLTPRFTDIFTDFENKTPTVLQSRSNATCYEHGNSCPTGNGRGFKFVLLPPPCQGDTQFI